jgi:hypothetical protein
MLPPRSTRRQIRKLIRHRLMLRRLHLEMTADASGDAIFRKPVAQREQAAADAAHDEP